MNFVKLCDFKTNNFFSPGNMDGNNMRDAKMLLDQTSVANSLSSSTLTTQRDNKHPNLISVNPFVMKLFIVPFNVKLMIRQHMHHRPCYY